MQKKQVKVIRSAVGSIGTWGLIHELQKNNVEVIGIDADPNAYAFKLLKKTYLIPKANTSQFFPELLKIIKRERPDAYLTGPEEETLILSRHRAILEKNGVLLLCPEYNIVKICANKARLYKTFDRLGIDYPKIYSRKSVRFPCIVKPMVGRGGKDVTRIDNEKDLNHYFSKHNENKTLIQEYISGPEYSVDILSDHGVTVSAVPRIRIQTDSGIAVNTRTVDHKSMISICKHIVLKLNLFGPICMQCIQTKDNTLKFTDINCRFGGGAIVSLHADTTIVKNLIRIIQKQKPIISSSYINGLVMQRYYAEVYRTQ